MKKGTIVIDATKQSLGRVASRAAFLLIGKHQTTFDPASISMQEVVIRNCAKISIPRKKLIGKIYYRTSGHPGAVKQQTLGQRFEKDASALLRDVVRKMLPRNRSRDNIMKLLKTEN